MLPTSSAEDSTVEIRSEGEEEEEQQKQRQRSTAGRDIRRYYCEFCGLCRSKKSLIAAHSIAQHKEEIRKKEEELGKGEGDDRDDNKNKCEECGATFKKPAHLKQHLLAHSDKRPFVCPLDDCPSSYQRKDHLTRHLLTHKGKLFSCPVEACKSKFVYQGNMTRHVKEFHGDDHPCLGEKQHLCEEEGCGKVFKYASQLRKHEDSHVKLEYVEAVCGEPGCMKVFTNPECLKAHIRSCHQHISCEICGTKQLRKNFKRHQRIHTGNSGNERINCTVEGCQYTFSNKSNLNKHLKAVHIELRPFSCRFAGCGKTFPYKHVRDNHEKSSAHVCREGDFLETDEQFRSRPRGGRKRKSLPVESLLRKRIVPPGHSLALDNGTEYLRWILLDDQNE